MPSLLLLMYVYYLRRKALALLYTLTFVTLLICAMLAHSSLQLIVSYIREA